MMGNFTLARYLVRRYLVNVGVVFGTCIALIFLVESVENLRRAGNHDIGFDVVFLLSIYRLPWLSEQVLPFAVLFAAMMTFLMLSKSLELVVARSVGISVWQFIAPTMATTLVIGIAATTLYNPLAAELKSRHENLFADAFGVKLGGLALTGAGFWLRQDGADGPSVINAAVQRRQGLRLLQVTAWLYNKDGSFRERVEAESAILQEGRWRMNDAWVVEPSREPEFHGHYLVSTHLTREQVRDSIASAETVSFWDLPKFIVIAERAGLPAIQYRLQYQTLLARPLLLCAMVLIAATVSLRLFRLGNIGRMILGGVVAGFVLYVLTKLASDLGGANAVAPVLAAWTPAVVTLLLGATALLYQEDG